MMHSKIQFYLNEYSIFNIFKTKICSYWKSLTQVFIFGNLDFTILNHYDQYNRHLYSEFIAYFLKELKKHQKHS